jgi:hypothetical protein
MVRFAGPHERIIAERLNAADAAKALPYPEGARSRSRLTLPVVTPSGRDHPHPSQIEPAKSPLVRFGANEKKRRTRGDQMRRLKKYVFPQNNRENVSYGRMGKYINGSKLKRG